MEFKFSFLNGDFVHLKRLGLGLWCLMPLSTIFQWCSLLLVEETGVPGENH